MESKTDIVIPFKLNEPSLEEIRLCLHSSLEKNFQHISTSIIDCPDLSVGPWNLTGKSLGGMRKIADVGGPDNIHFMKNNNKTYQVEDITKAVGIPDGFVIGPAAASSQCIKEGVLAELITDCNVSTHQIHSKSCKVISDGSYVLENYNSNEIGALANLLVCEGKPCEVICIKCSTRKGEENFISCLRKSLDENFKNQSIGLAGVFEIKKGSIRAHVMPDFPKRDMISKKEVDEWLKFYEMKAPLVCISVFISNDRDNLGLRLEHTHFYSAHGDGGHYHFDTTPLEVEYEAYFVPCQEVYRLNPPK